MPCPRLTEVRAQCFLEELKEIFSVADCITAQTAMAIAHISQYRVWQYFRILAKAGYIEMHKIKRGPIHMYLYCLPGRKPEKIYIHNGRRAYLIRLKDVIKALEEVLKSFSTYTAAVRIRRLKDVLNLPNTSAISLILKHMVTSVIKDAIIKEEIRDNSSVYSVVLVVDKEKALKLIEEYKRGSSFS